MGEIHIRLGRPDDSARIAVIQRASRAAAMPWLPVLHTPVQEFDFFSGLVESTTTYVAEVGGAELGGDVVGFAIVDAAGTELEHLYLDPSSRRVGIGSALLARVRETFDGPLELWVFADNVDARAFYAAHGAQELFSTDGSDNEERTPDVRLLLPRLR